METRTVSWFIFSTSLDGENTIDGIHLWKYLTHNLSHGWTSIVAEKLLIDLGKRRKVHSGNEIKAWEDPWISTIHVRHARSFAPVVHPKMWVSDFLIKDPRRGNIRLLENYITKEDIPLIQSLAINQTYLRDDYCWIYTKNGMYAVKYHMKCGY